MKWSLFGVPILFKILYFENERPELDKKGVTHNKFLTKSELDTYPEIACEPYKSHIWNIIRQKTQQNKQNKKNKQL